MIQPVRSIWLLVLCSAAVFAFILTANAPLASGQTRAGQTPTNATLDKPAQTLLADVSGDWRVTWEGRLGSQQCLLHLQQDGTKLTGTFKDLHGLSPLTGTVDAKGLSFEVQFKGPRPFTTQFKGSAIAGKIDGTSQAVGVGGSGAYLGHGGEIVQPEHPWTAIRVESQPAASAQNGYGHDSNSSSPTIADN